MGNASVSSLGIAGDRTGVEERRDGTSSLEARVSPYEPEIEFTSGRFCLSSRIKR